MLPPGHREVIRMVDRIKIIWIVYCPIPSCQIVYSPLSENATQTGTFVNIRHRWIHIRLEEPVSVKMERCFHVGTGWKKNL